MPAVPVQTSSLPPEPSAQAPLRGTGNAEEDFWQETLASLNAYVESPPTNNKATIRTALRQLTSAVDHLRKRAPLEITATALCRRIHGFGNYERFAQYHFQPGQPVLLYAQVVNFHSQPKGNLFEVVLQSTLEISDQHGRTVWRQEFAPTPDHCRERRRDFYLTFGGAGNVRTPKTEPGKYALTLIVKDQSSGKTANSSVIFHVR